MAGIVSFAAYVPYLRLPLDAIRGDGRKAGRAPGEKAVANWDEDALTMGVAAAAACLEGIDRAAVDAVFFASTSYAFQEKQAAAAIVRALDLRRDVATADFRDSLRAGTGALRAALDAVRAGSARKALVVASDARPAPPGSALERSFGDAAAAVLVGEQDVAATVDTEHAIADEMLDVWRTERDPFVHSWEDRFVVDHGYRRNVVEAARALLEKSGLAPADFAKLVLYAPDARSAAAAAAAMGFDPRTQLQDPFFGRIGNCGAASPLLLLVAALESSRGGDRLLLVSYGDGADAFAVRVGDPVADARRRRGVEWHLARRAELASYDKYLRFRQLLAVEHDRRAGAGISATVHYRERDADVSLLAQRCLACGTTQYPFQRVCFGCYAKDRFAKVRLSDRIGKVLSFTFDEFAGSPDPPLIATVTDVDGARLYVQMTDAAAADVRLEMPVELTFRKIHEGGGTPSYYWKCTPVRGAGTTEGSP
ncbi:MAG: hydroxymethylglutaryl-CoA synthase [Candidatus Binatota bacterium]|jgi:3-hydroxy-3-methylglutaryl CoA synthase|nr:hydroxymethylglutaryl-CoA synthase [Candidatus Binatota bacterium]